MKYFTPKRMPRENNPHWPLPRDYPTMTARGRKQARLNALLNQETPEDLVAAWDLFRNHYLVPTPEGQWYAHGFKPSPAYHYQFIRDLGTYPYNAWAAPRSAAKSTVIAGEIPLLFLCTRPNFESIVFFSAGKFVKMRFDKFQVQLETNERIIEDFGELKPPRGKGMWNHSQLKLTNGASCYGEPIEGRMLGLRPQLLLFDDVEFDPALVAAPTLKTAAFENLMQNVALPMMEQGTCMGVIGTLHRRSFYIYHLCTTTDPKYARWNRRIISAFDDSGELTWKEKLSAEFLAEKKELMGTAAFMANYGNQPGTESDKVLALHPELGYYDLVGEDGLTLNSASRLRSARKTGTNAEGLPIIESVDRPFGEVLSKMYRVLCVDYAPTISPHSDFCCIMCLGFENSDFYKDTLWVLDMMLDKVKSDVLIKRIWEMASRWRVQIVGVEAISIQKELADRVAIDVAEYATLLGAYVPRVMPIKYPSGLSKADRIGGLQWRFNQFRIKLPRQHIFKKPWDALFHQIADFTDDLALLQKDDAVDTLAMQQYVVRPRANASASFDIPEAPRSEFEMLMRDGELYNELGSPIVTQLGAGQLTRDVVNKLREIRSSREDDRTERRRRR